MKFISLLFVFTLLIFPQGRNPIEIPAVFSDNMVLQQNTEVNFWGKAEPGFQINITGSWGSSVNTVVNATGTFNAKLKTPVAGGPYQVYLQIGDTTVIYKNVLIGEVWICSGQSNMEMPLMGWPPNDLIQGSDEAIKNAENKNIRLFTVARAISNEEEFNCIGTWDELTPKTAAGFSATAFFFGEKLYEELKIPIGLIHSSWGGTPAEAWTSSRYLKSMNDFTNILNEIEKSKDELKNYNKWLESHRIIDFKNLKSEKKWQDLSFEDEKCSEVDFDDSNWKLMNLPVLWESTEVGNFDGAIWFRKSIEIPDEWKNQDLILSLGPIDDMDRTFINGELIGKYEDEGFWQTDRVYKIPKELVKSNKVVIAVRVIDNQGGGGIWGTKDKMTIHPENMEKVISLAGDWKYLPVAEYRAQRFYVFGCTKNDFYEKPKMKIDISAYTPTTLYNAMIHPLIPYNIAGAIWYQGESNAGNPKQYETLFPLMIMNWRSDWNEGDFPFYFVQIAPYDYGEQTHSELLREAQLKTLSLKNTGMAVTLDIGNPKNIHPGNKKDVGERLALWALAKNYNKKKCFSGPIYKSMKIQNDKIILTFDYAKSGLVIKDPNVENNFIIAGKDKVFKKAKVKIEGDKLIISNDEIKNPVAVRYAFTNISEGTLFNKEGLPASSFRTDSWDR